MPATDHAQRSCLGCRKVLGKNELVRYVLDPEGEICVDLKQKLPGRGAYSCLSRKCLSEAVRRGQFSRAFRGRNKNADSDRLTAELTRQLAEKIDNLLGILRKAGLAVGGGNAVTAALEKGEGLQLILFAEDISDGVFEKIRRKALAARVPFFTWSTKAELGRLTGSEQRSVLGLKQSALATALKEGLERYEQFVGEI